MSDLKSDKVVRLIGYKLFEDRYMYRLYMVSHVELRMVIGLEC